jgi:rhomboid protease GluP
MALYQWDRSRKFWSSPTIVLIVANVIVFIFLLAGGDAAYNLLGQTGDLFFNEHFYWQLFTSLFVHFDFQHIILNMFGLYYFGRLNESHFTDSQFYAIYFGSGLLGSVMSLFLLPIDTMSGGASGAIFGLVGSYIAVARQAQHLGAALVYAVLIFVMSSGPGVDIFAHLFGLVGGLVLGLIFLSTRKPIGYSTSYTYTA